MRVQPHECVCSNTQCKRNSCLMRVQPHDRVIAKCTCNSCVAAGANMFHTCSTHVQHTTKNARPADNVVKICTRCLVIVDTHTHAHTHQEFNTFASSTVNVVSVSALRSASRRVVKHSTSCSRVTRVCVCVCARACVCVHAHVCVCVCV